MMLCDFHHGFTFKQVDLNLLHKVLYIYHMEADHIEGESQDTSV